MIKVKNLKEFKKEKFYKNVQSVKKKNSENLGGAKQWHSSGDRKTRNAREKYLIHKTERGK